MWTCSARRPLAGGTRRGRLCRGCHRLVVKVLIVPLEHGESQPPLRATGPTTAGTSSNNGTNHAASRPLLLEVAARAVVNGRVLAIASAPLGRLDRRERRAELSQLTRRDPLLSTLGEACPRNARRTTVESRRTPRQRAGLPCAPPHRSDAAVPVRRQLVASSSTRVDAKVTARAASSYSPSSIPACCAPAPATLRSRIRGTRSPAIATRRCGRRRRR